MVYVITYNLNQPGRDYKALYEALMQYEYIRDPALESVWFISIPNTTATDITNYLLNYIDATDRLFVTKIKSGEAAGWMHSDIWSWINARL